MTNIIFLLVAAFASLAFGFSANDVVDAHQRSRASSEVVLDVAQVRDRPFTVQVGSYLNEIQAIEQIEILKNKGFEAFYYPNFIKNQILFKVCVGRFMTEKEAQEFHKSFISETKENLSVIASLLARPGSDQKATEQLLNQRQIASVDSKSPNKKLKSTSSKSQHYYALQIGSYPSADLAEKALKEAQSDMPQQEIFYKEADVAGKKWFRLYLGRFQEFQKANLSKSEIKSDKYSTAIVRKLFD